LNSALLGRDRKKCRYALFHVLAFALGASEFLLVVLCQAQSELEGLFAFLANEFVHGHRRIPSEVSRVYSTKVHFGRVADGNWSVESASKQAKTTLQRALVGERGGGWL
jgi:hypothetical protein